MHTLYASNSPNPFERCVTANRKTNRARARIRDALIDDNLNFNAAAREKSDVSRKWASLITHEKDNLKLCFAHIPLRRTARPPVRHGVASSVGHPPSLCLRSKRNYAVLGFRKRRTMIWGNRCTQYACIMHPAAHVNCPLPPRTARCTHTKLALLNLHIPAVRACELSDSPFRFSSSLLAALAVTSLDRPHQLKYILKPRFPLPILRLCAHES